MGILKFCSCRYCRRGKKHPVNQKMINQAIGSNRRKNKIAVKTGDYEKIIDTIPIIYTD